MRIRTPASLSASALLFGGLAFGGPFADTATPPIEVRAAFHLQLDHSSPEADEVVESPARIALWFTQAPQISGTSVRLVPAGGEPLDLGAARVSDDDDTLIILDVAEPLAGGVYEVYWRAMAQDGHTVRGDFGFTVKAR